MCLWANAHINSIATKRHRLIVSKFGATSTYRFVRYTIAREGALEPTTDIKWARVSYRTHYRTEILKRREPWIFHRSYQATNPSTSHTSDDNSMNHKTKCKYFNRTNNDSPVFNYCTFASQDTYIDWCGGWGGVTSIETNTPQFRNCEVPPVNIRAKYLRQLSARVAFDQNLRARVQYHSPKLSCPRSAKGQRNYRPRGLEIPAEVPASPDYQYRVKRYHLPHRSIKNGYSVSP